MKYKLIAPYNNNYTEIEQILINRGVSYQDISKFLQPTADALIPPYALANIENAARCLLKHLLHQHKIFIQVDSDCDGYTSSAILINYLHKVFPSLVENNIIYNLHDTKHHGLIIDTIPTNVQLVIAPDSSSNENEVHEALIKNGIDVIVLDHHHAEKVDSDASIIVNNQMCGYPNKTLSGAGIVYKFCCALDDIIHVSYANDFLDLAALGCVADMMDIRNPETRYIIYQGFDELNNIFFNKLAQKQAFPMGGEITPHTVSWYIAPLINAMARSGTKEEKCELFQAMLDYQALQLTPSTKKGSKSGDMEPLVDKAVRLCGSVKTRQEKNKTDALDMINPLLNDNETVMNIIKLDNPVDTNLTGLLANTIMGNYHLPVLVLNKSENGWEGSGRGMETELVPDWRAFIADSGYALYAEGHAGAFGVGFTDEGLVQFQAYLKAYFKGSKVETCTPVDFIWTNNDIFDKSILKIAEGKALWGQNVDEPNIILKAMPLHKENIRLLGKGTLRIDLTDHETSIIKYNSEDLYNQIVAAFPYDESVIYITILGTCSINNYMGITPQIKLVDYEIERVEDFVF